MLKTLRTVTSCSATEMLGNQKAANAAADDEQRSPGVAQQRKAVADHDESRDAQHHDHRHDDREDAAEQRSEGGRLESHDTSFASRVQDGIR